MFLAFICLLSLFQPAPAHAVSPSKQVSFVFDGGYERIYTELLPVLEEYHIKGTVYVPAGCIEGTGPCRQNLNPNAKYMSWSQIQDLKNTYGWEIGSQGLDYKRFTSLTPEEREYQLTESNKIFEQRIGVRPKSFASPYGDIDFDSVAQIAKHHTSNRLANDQSGPNEWPYSDYYLSVVHVNNGSDIQAVYRLINDAIDKKQWLILVFDDISWPKLTAVAQYYRVKTQSLNTAAQISNVLTTNPTIAQDNLLTYAWFNEGGGEYWLTDDSDYVTEDTSNTGIAPYSQNAIKFTGNGSYSTLYSHQIPATGSTYYFKGYVDTRSMQEGSALGFFIDEYDAAGNWISWQWHGEVDVSVASHVYDTYQRSSDAVQSFSIGTIFVGDTNSSVYIDNYQVFNPYSNQTLQYPPALANIPTHPRTPIPEPTPEPTPTPDAPFTVTNLQFDHSTMQYSFDYSGYKGGDISTESVAVHAIDESWGYNDEPASCTGGSTGSGTCSGTFSFFTYKAPTYTCSQNIYVQIYGYNHGYTPNSKTGGMTNPDPACSGALGFHAEYFSNQTLTGAPSRVRQDNSINFDWGNGSPDISIPADKFSARWTKTEAFEAGNYEFTISGDDGVRVFVDNELIINGWKDQGTTTYTDNKVLIAGDHTIRVEYYENGGGAAVKFDYKKLSNTPPPSSGYAAEYFANRTLSDAPTLTRTDAAINFEWNGGSPASVIPADDFSARWTKTENFAAGTYEFTTTSDDGVRLYIDGELLIDKWIDQGSTTYKATKALASGNHTIVVEYYEKGGGAVMKFNYAQTNVAPPSQTTSFTGEYFNNKTLSSSVAMTRSDAAIDFDWAGGSPDPLINADNFSARWTKTDVFEAGNYEFTVTADDGIRVKVDGEVLIDKFIDQGATTYKAKKAMTAGNHTVVIEYYEAGGGALVKANYVKVGDVTPPSPTEKYQAKYWNLPAAISQPAVPTTVPNLTREEDTIDHAWNDDAPAADINANGYVAQWIKTQTFEAATYKFTTESDDGIRVFIDDQPVIDQWNDHGLTTHTGTSALTAGNHVIRVEYYENTGGAVAKFNFEKGTIQAPNPEPGIANGFNVDFFNNIDLSGAAVLSKVYDAINFIFNDGSPDAVVNNDNFSARITKTKQFAAGTYNFTLKSDDGVRFWIDDQLLVDDWNDHAMKTYDPTVTLTEGLHTIKIEYYEKAGGAVLIFEEK